MALLITTIGSYPKPKSLSFLNWTNSETMCPTGSNKDYGLFLRGKNKAFEALIVEATRRAVLDQVGAGIDIPTDGEMAREDYIYYHCRHLRGIDFRQLTRKSVRRWSARGRGAYNTRKSKRSASQVSDSRLGYCAGFCR